MGEPITVPAIVAVYDGYDTTRKMDAWKVTLKYEGRRYTLPFYMGSGYNAAPPELKDVLYAIFSDTHAWYDNDDFDGFCDSFGYSNDSIKASGIYKACEKSAIRTLKLFGLDSVEELEALETVYRGRGIVSE